MEAEWLPRVLVQIGAHDHGSTKHDKVPVLLARGWRGVLIEPLPWAAQRLRQRYSLQPNQVRIIEAAVCTNASARTAVLTTINSSNTLSHGQNESDVRCLGKTIRDETASLSRSHLLRHSRTMRFTPAQCETCASAVGHALPPTCMRHVLKANMASFTVACARDWTDELHRFDGDATRRRSTGATEGMLTRAATTPRAPHLLKCDAEGADDAVLQRYFAAGLPAPAVVIFEQLHLRHWQRAEVGKLLSAHGMVPFNLSQRIHMRGARRPSDGPHGHALDPPMNLLLDPMQPSRAAMNAVWIRRSVSHQWLN